MAVPVLRGTPRSQWVIWSAPNTCPHLSTIYVEKLEHHPVLCSLNVHQISTVNMASLFTVVEVVETKNSTFKGHVHIHIYTHLHKQCISCWQIQWLIWACWSVKSHLLFKETGRLLWSGSWLWIPDVAPNPVSQPLLSSMVERGRTAEQISLCFSTMAEAAPANTSAKQHLKAVDFLFITASWTAFFWVWGVCVCVFWICVCVCLYDLRRGYYQRRQTKIDDLWLL